MIKNEYTLKVDLKKKYSAVTPTFVQYDAAVLRFIITDDGKPLYFTGLISAKTYHRRIDGVVVEGDATLEIVKGQSQIVYKYQGNEMYQLGFVETSLVIYSGDKKVSIQPFKVKIVDSIYDDAATPSNPEHGALQHLIVSVEDLIDRTSEAANEASVAAAGANAARDNANSAVANIQEAIGEWKYGNAYDMSVNYKKNNVVSYNGSAYIAIKDNIGNVPTGDIDDLNWRIVARKGEDGEGLVVLHKKDFVATLNQTDFTLPHEYDQHQGRVRVIVDGVEQFTPENFVEQSSSKVRLNSSLRQGADVKIIYFGNAPALKNDIQLQIDNINNLLENFNLSEANIAIAHANTQGDHAKAQGDFAKAQGDLAKNATTQANTAKDSANSAATSANTATQNANTAKDAANIATGKANTASALAEAATASANQARSDAIAATNSANLAKDNANTAAFNANEAASNLSHKGDYSSTVDYLPRNIVFYLGSSYMNIIASKGVLPTDPTKWKKVGEKGDKGDRGISLTWKKEYSSTTSYLKDDVVNYNGSSYIAIRDNLGKTPVGDINDLDWNIAARKGSDGTGTLIRYRDAFISSENQSVFTLSNSYDQHLNRIDVIVGGVPQYSPDNFTESSSTTITLSTGIPSGLPVIVTYFSQT